MQELQIWNDQVLLRIARDARLAFRLTGEETFYGDFEFQEGVVEVEGIAPVRGLLYYAMPCVFESLVVQLEGIATPSVFQTVGEWPTDIDDDQLETYPHLHFLEERKTGTPWRLERWYTLAGSYLIFDSQQYFERSRPVQHGKNWERLMVQLRQVADLPSWASHMDRPIVNLISSGRSYII
ncbi:MAG: hypothetical protein H5T63_05270 [Chloroflexi bacterium]|nr:hypothetical protein [Chloroflexota bacterium]